MFQRNERYDLPKTVEEVADLLISDLLVQHREALAGMSEKDFDQFYQSVAPFLLAEFKLWTGNDELLNSCMSAMGESDAEENDPAKVILRRVKEKLSDIYGFIITS